CPSLLFKSEAIVHPDDIAKYIDPRECQLSYNPLLMAELWEAAATKQTKLLALSLAKRHALPPGTAWVNYIRCHDDIGWTFADEDAAQVAMNGYDHRQFLNRFYTGEFPGTFARGVPFQFNPDTGDRRICGSAASLAGVERALKEHLGEDLETALARIILLQTITYVAGGIPLLYLGDEVAVLNRYDYVDDPTQAGDSRWVHRPLWSESLAAQRHDPKTPAGRIFEAFVRLGRLRRDHPALGTQPLTVLEAHHPSVLAFAKEHAGRRIVVVGNFADHRVTLGAETAGSLFGPQGGTELLSGQKVAGNSSLDLAPCGCLVVLA
ncbi:MAG TPA: amylosucrase, partial [Spirochaetia bacterium]|nr:amylosucrase [Spirochaetia bacterium]